MALVGPERLTGQGIPLPRLAPDDDGQAECIRRPTAIKWLCFAKIFSGARSYARIGRELVILYLLSPG